MVILVGLLYKMWQVQILKKSYECDINTINDELIKEVLEDTDAILDD